MREYKDSAEVAIRAHREAGRFDDAVSTALEAYSSELFGYIRSMTRTATEAEDVFGDMSERLWTHFGRFRGDSSVRTWLYSIARNLARSHERRKSGPRGREVPLTESVVAVLDDPTYTTAPVYLQVELEKRLHSLRNALPPQDRMLIALRIDRAMSWREIARAFDPDDSSPEQLARRCAALRKRFGRIKDKLRSKMADLAQP